MKKIIHTFLFFQGIVASAQQVNTYTPASSALELLTEIAGAGIQVTNAQLACGAEAYGKIQATGLPISEGIVLSTGKASKVIDPNSASVTTFNYGIPGDVNLNIQAGFTTFDGCALEFDFIAQCPNIDIPYFFASEEYPYDASKAFNDVMGIYLAPAVTPYAYTNLSVVAGNPVGVSTVNQNTGSYNPNPGGLFPFDGYTTQFIASATVTPCDPYHMKIVIADGGDGDFDSGLFIEKGSVMCSGSVYAIQDSVINTIEGCLDGRIKICRSGSTASSQSVTYTVLPSSTATAGADYVALSGNAVIAAGNTCEVINITQLPDALQEGLEFVDIEYQPGPCALKETIRIEIEDQFFVSAPDQTTCSGTPVSIGVPNDPGFTYQWSTSPDLSSTSISNPQANNLSGLSVNYDVTYILTVTETASGCQATDQVKVTYKPAPTVQFTANAACLGNVTVFTNNTVPNSASVDNQIWDFGNGFVSFLQAPSHQYNAAGTYNVTLTVENSNHCTTSLTQPVYVWDLPIADFTPNNSCEETPSTFMDVSIAPIGDPIAAWAWNFGDGTTSVLPNPVHTFSSTGNQSVQLIVATVKGCIGLVNETVTIYPKPEANFTATNNCVGVNTVFDDVSTISSGAITNWNWNFGGMALSTLQDPVFNFPAVAPYLVTLEIISDHGCKDTAKTMIDIYNRPTADFTSNEVVTCESSCVNFTNQSFDVTSSLTYFWDFGIAQYSQDTDPIQCYGIDGQYTVELTATNIYGCSDTKTKIDYIKILPRPYAAFDAVQSEQLFDPSMILTDYSIGEISQWIWNMGDSTQYIYLTSKDFEHYYDIPGNYTIHLTVKGKNGCNDSTTKEIRVNQNYKAWIPSAFTPNGNYKNETFYPKMYLYPGQVYTMYIFDRWGKMIYQTDQGIAWDGTILDTKEPAKQDTYAYKVILVDDDGEETIYAGHVTLIR